RYTDLLDPGFPDKLAAFAARVAERYPWIEQWTPVNEPLTTARFSALYGHWYPHRADEASFLRALVNQCLGTHAAMAAIRAVNPQAKLLQTEDLGKTWATAPLRYQAAHENERRWLSFDLLAGRVSPYHPFYRRLIDHGIGVDALATLARGEARPDIIGINHYLTSERFLDHRFELYPGRDRGGNGRDAYIDAEAVRVNRLHRFTGIGPRLREAWQRYGIPMVVGEVHHGCTRDEQLRWFAEVWKTCGALRSEGVDLRAVTLWSLFGNVDWRSLLTQDERDYDVGAFDVRGPAPRPTVVAAAAKSFAAHGDFDHPVLDMPGWWRRDERLYDWHGAQAAPRVEGRQLLITGATGTLGKAFARICDHRGLPYRLTSRDELDLGSARSVTRAIARHRPWAVINTAGFVRIADAERERRACLSANADGAGRLARACADVGIQLLTFSSDLVFDGKRGHAYVESDTPNPQTVYGLSKAIAETQVAAADGQPLIVRTSAFFGPWDRHNFATKVLAALSCGEPFLACRKTIVTPTYVPDLVHAALDLLIDGATGIWHVANHGALSWHEFARRIAVGAGYDSALVLPLDSAEPASTALGSERGSLLRPIDHAIEHYLRAVGAFAEIPPEMNIAAE
ncbi:MAG: sugar nucleotide-binding protein, partial [Pseudomonadota bacterium]|nr:sugar nucleotide-binding protein [Pseudomonadota bacterium]